MTSNGPVAEVALHARKVILFALLLGFALLQDPVKGANASPTTSDLNSVVILGPNNGWAVGNGGVILHFDGSFWSEIASGTTSDLFGVSFGPPGSESSSAGFAVGGSGGTGNAIYRDQVTWSSATTGLTAPSAQRLASVFELSPSDAWAVDGVSGAFWHWTGTVGLGGGWSLISSAAAGLNSVFMLSPSEGWAVGSGGLIYKYTSGGWVLNSALGTSLNSVFMVSSNDGWAVWKRRNDLPLHFRHMDRPGLPGHDWPRSEVDLHGQPNGGLGSGNSGHSSALLRGDMLRASS